MKPKMSIGEMVFYGLLMIGLVIVIIRFAQPRQHPVPAAAPVQSTDPSPWPVEPHDVKG